MFPLTKSVTFNQKNGGLDIVLKYDKQAPICPGLPYEIAKYEIGKAERLADKSEYKFKFIVTVQNDIHQIPKLESCNLVEEWNETV